MQGTSLQETEISLADPHALPAAVCMRSEPVRDVLSAASRLNAQRVLCSVSCILWPRAAYLTPASSGNQCNVVTLDLKLQRGQMLLCI